MENLGVFFFAIYIEYNVELVQINELFGFHRF